MSIAPRRGGAAIALLSILSLLFALSWTAQLFLTRAEPRKAAPAVAQHHSTAVSWTSVELAADPTLNPRGIRLTAREAADLDAIVLVQREERRLATAQMHEHALERARLRIDLGQAELWPHDSPAPQSPEHARATSRAPDTRPARAPEGGAKVGLSDAHGHWRVTILPGEHEPFDIALAEREALETEHRRHIADFFSTLAAADRSPQELTR